MFYVYYINVQICFKVKIQILILKSRHLITDLVHRIDVVAHGLTHGASSLPGHVDDVGPRLNPGAGFGLVRFHHNGVVQLDSSSLPGFFFEVSGSVGESRGKKLRDVIHTCDNRGKL